LHVDLNGEAIPAERQSGVMQSGFSSLLFRTCLAGCLLGLVGTIYFFAGLAGYVRNPLVNLFVAASVIGAALWFLSAFLVMPLETNWVGRGIWIVITIIMLTEIILSLVPPTGRDELTHHLAIPRLYARAGRIIEVPFAPYAYYPMFLDMLYTPWVHWGYDSVPKLVHGLFGLLTGLALHAYLSRRMNAIYGLLGFVFFLSIPVVLRLSHSAYVDLGVTFYSTASLLCMLRWREEKDSKKWLILAAASAGFSVATKPNGLVVWLLMFFLFAFTVASEPRRGLRTLMSELTVFVVMGSLPFLPWLMKNWYQTGNPFFPLLGSFFPAKVLPGAAPSLNFVEIGILAKRQLLYGESWWQIAGLPFRVFFSGQDDNPQYFDGVLSPILILLLPWAFKGKWLEEKRLVASFACLFLAYAIFLIDLRVRYVLLIVPPLIVLMVYGIFNVYLRVKQPVILYGGLLLFAGLHASYLWHDVRETAPAAYLSGQESREEYLTRTLADYPAFRFINRELPQNARIYLLFVGRRAYYCEREYFHDGGELPGFLLAALRSAKEPADVGRQLNAKQLTHLLVRDELLLRFLRDNLDPAQQQIWNGFASSHLEALFRDRGYSVLQLHGKFL
jgi:hypothetical protein